MVLQVNELKFSVVVMCIVTPMKKKALGKYLLSSFVLRLIFLLLSGNSKGWVRIDCIWGSSFRVCLLSRSRNVGFLVSIPVHVLLCMGIVVVLQESQTKWTKWEISSKHLDSATSSGLHLWVRVIVQPREWVVIVAGAVIILVCGHIWHSCNQKE